MVRDMLLQCNILILQGLCLLEDDHSNLEGVSELFYNDFVPNEPPANELREGRPSAGLLTFF